MCLIQPNCDYTISGDPPAEQEERLMIMHYLISRIRAHQRYRQTALELGRYSDHQLDDIGIYRFEIDDIARRQFNW